MLACAGSVRAEYRTIDGTGNNLANSTWGATGTQLSRISPVAYDDGISTARGSTDPTLPNPRAISNTVIAQSIMAPNSHEMTDWVFQWGQFVDHDLDLTNLATPVENFDVPIPAGDSIFDAGNTGAAVMSFQRSKYDPTTGTNAGNPRQQINDITSYLDASMVYGSDTARATALRTLSGGKLKTSAGNLLPLNTFGLPNGTGGPADPTQFYLAGDVRANEQVGLTTVHTLFMREHNRLADQISAAHPGLSDEEIYQRARKLVGAEIQSITYREFLPALLGTYAPTITSTYDPDLNSGVLTEFSTALFRVGHTMLSPQLMRMTNDDTPAPGGAMSLRDSFFRMQNLAGANELEYFLKGLAYEQQQQVDMHIVDDVRNFLFGEPIPGGFDLATLNIQRGRDHGLADYNTVREAFGLPAVSSFAQITSDTEVQAGLQSLYGSVDRIDAWVGALSEDHLPGASVGPLIVAGLAEQFRRARDGDRFWFTRDADIAPEDLNWLLSVRLSDIIRLNTSITNLQGNVFFMAVPEPSTAAMLAILGGVLGLGLRRRSARPCAE
ncbi:MAG: peroxidase family protein [Pirellulales bacterium]